MRAHAHAQGFGVKQLLADAFKLVLSINIDAFVISGHFASQSRDRGAATAAALAQVLERFVELKNSSFPPAHTVS